MSSPDNSTRSPYFTPKRVTPPKQTSSSYFPRQYVCPVASVQAVGPLLLCLSTRKELPPTCQRHQCCSASNAATSASVACEPCGHLISESRAHFRSCSFFEDRWQQRDATNSKLENDTEGVAREPCWMGAERRLHFAVRHLCNSNCYMRAYAPYRAWHTVRSATSPMAYDEKETSSPAVGWKCKLVSPLEVEDGCPEIDTGFGVSQKKRRRTMAGSQRSGLPRLMFLSVSGEQSHSENALIRKLRPRHRQHKRLCTNLFPRQRVETNNPQETRSCHDIPQTVLAHPVETPFGLLEELFHDDVWRLLLSAILLNRTTRKQVDSVLFAFLQQWPSPEAVFAANPADMAHTLRPLGMNHRRTRGILRFTEQYMRLLGTKEIHRLEREDILSLYNCGEYAYHVYQLFIQRNWSIDPSDVMLNVYAHYQRMKQRENKKEAVNYAIDVIDC